MTVAMLAAEAHVNEMLGHGLAFEEIEEYINASPLDAEEKSVLWLLAWSEQARDYRRKVVVSLVS